jgi:tetratricopeptide (TPR) repeat protein
MFHEANHYLTTLIDPRFRYPIWVNESLAEYYGASQWDPKTKKMTIGGLQEGRLAVIQDAIRADEWQGLEKMIRLEQGEFNATHYAWGWSFVHWLLQDKKTERKFKDFYLALARDPSIKREPAPPSMKAVPTEEVIKALLRFLDVKSIDELQKGWYEYVKTLKPSSGRGYYEAGRMAMMRGMPIKAQRYLRTALDMDFKGPQVYAELGQALYEKDKDNEAIETLKKAIALDPLNPEFYLSLARAYWSRNPKDPEVKRYRWMALEIAKATNDPNEYAILVDVGPDYTKPDPDLPSNGK